MLNPFLSTRLCFRKKRKKLCGEVDIFFPEKICLDLLCCNIDKPKTHKILHILVCFEIERIRQSSNFLLGYVTRIILLLGNQPADSTSDMTNFSLTKMFMSSTKIQVSCFLRHALFNNFHKLYG